MVRLGTVAAIVLAGAAAILTLSGGIAAGPHTPQGPEGMPPPFTAVAAVGSGGPAAAVDPYGTITDLRSPSPAGVPLIETEYQRQRAGSVAPDTGIVIRAGTGPSARPLWEGIEQRQSYLPHTNVLETEGTVAGVRVRIRDATTRKRPGLVRQILAEPVAPSTGRDQVRLSASLNFDFGAPAEAGRRQVVIDPAGKWASVTTPMRQVNCQFDGDAALNDADGSVEARWVAERQIRAAIRCGFEGSRPPEDAAVAIRGAAVSDRRWLSRAAVLAKPAPDWARQLHRRSQLVLRAHTDPATGATLAGLRDHWDYVWPRDAATVALAFGESGHEAEARAIARFIRSLDTEVAARFTPDGVPVQDGRQPQGDGAGWRRLALRVGNLPPEKFTHGEWRDRGDYGERHDERGDFLANAIAAGVPAPQILSEFGQNGLLHRTAGDSQSPLDTAVAWAAQPFPRPQLAPQVRDTLLSLAEQAGPYGLLPTSDWPGEDAWTAATATATWGLAEVGPRPQARRLAEALHRAMTPAGLLPERADRENGDPRSTTPLAWSHALALLALSELWPTR